MDYSYRMLQKYVHQYVHCFPQVTCVNANGHIHLDLPVLHTSHCCNINLTSKVSVHWKTVLENGKKKYSYLQERSNVIAHPLHMRYPWKGILFIISYFYAKQVQKKISCSVQTELIWANWLELHLQSIQLKCLHCHTD